MDPVFSEGITDATYGQYSLLMHLSEDVFQLLECLFPYEKAASYFPEGQLYEDGKK